jgi:hypothetical protein
VTGRPSDDDPATVEHLLAMLRAVGDPDRAGARLDSAALALRLGWTDAETAVSLENAKGRLLIWGIRVGGVPAPRFEDIELTVQGRRLVTTTDH